MATEERTTVLNASNFAAHHGATTYHDYRVTEIDTQNLEGNVPLDAIRDVIQRVAEHVVVLKIELGRTRDPALEMILSAFYFLGAPLLKKLIVHENRKGYVPSGLGQEVFRMMHEFSRLEILELHGVCFSSAEFIEPFFVTTRALTTLVLNDIKTVGVASRELGPAFLRGLQHNKTLQNTSFVSTGRFEGRVLQACLVGIRNNRFVQELELDLRDIRMRDTFISAVRELASGTTAQKLSVTANCQALAEVMGGLSTNCSDNVQEVHCFLRPEYYEITRSTGLLQAIQGACQAWNGSSKKLSVFALRCVQNDFDRPLQSQHLNALFVRLRQVPISELVLSNCSIEPGEVPVLCELIRDAPLRKLDLSNNPIGAVGVAKIIKAASPNPLIEHLSMAWCSIKGENNNEDDSSDREDDSNDISNCHESIGMLVTLPRLVYLDLSGWRLSGPLAVASLAGGVRNSQSLKSFRMPLPLDSQSIEPIENALKENYSIVTLEMLFDPSFDLLHSSAKIQLYLELNRLGRRHYHNMPMSKPIPDVVLPHFFARMSGDEDWGKGCSHLYYFLRQTPPDSLAGQVSSSSKRKAREND